MAKPHHQHQGTPGGDIDMKALTESVAKASAEVAGVQVRKAIKEINQKRFIWVAGEVLAIGGLVWGVVAALLSATDRRIDGLDAAVRSLPASLAPGLEAKYTERLGVSELRLTELQISNLLAVADTEVNGARDWLSHARSEQRTRITTVSDGYILELRVDGGLQAPQNLLVAKDNAAMISGLPAGSPIRAAAHKCVSQVIDDYQTAETKIGELLESVKGLQGSCRAKKKPDDPLSEDEGKRIEAYRASVERQVGVIKNLLSEATLAVREFKDLKSRLP